MANNGNREQLTWHDVNADDLPANVRKSLESVLTAENKFKADLEAALKQAGHMPVNTRMVLSRKGKRLGVAFAKEAASGSRLQFK